MRWRRWLEQSAAGWQPGATTRAGATDDTAAPLFAQFRPGRATGECYLHGMAATQCGQ